MDMTVENWMLSFMSGHCLPPLFPPAVLKRGRSYHISPSLCFNVMSHPLCLCSVIKALCVHQYLTGYKTVIFNSVSMCHVFGLRSKSFLRNPLPFYRKSLFCFTLIECLFCISLSHTHTRSYFYSRYINNVLHSFVLVYCIK